MTPVSEEIKDELMSNLAVVPTSATAMHTSVRLVEKLKRLMQMDKTNTETMDLEEDQKKHTHSSNKLVPLTSLAPMDITSLDIKKT